MLRFRKRLRKLWPLSEIWFSTCAVAKLCSICVYLLHTMCQGHFRAPLQSVALCCRALCSDGGSSESGETAIKASKLCRSQEFVHLLLIGREKAKKTSLFLVSQVVA